MQLKDLRDFVSALEKQGQLIRIRDELEPRYEVSAVLDYYGQKEGPAVLFERVKGYSVPVLGNIFGSRKRFAMLFGTEDQGFLDAYVRRKKDRVPPVGTDDVPVKEIRIDHEIDLPNLLPILTYHEKDASPYITQGVVFLKNPETGHCSMGVHRMQLRGKDRLGVFIASRTSAEIIRLAEKKGIPIDVAVAIGVDPFVLIASLTRVDVANKMDLAGGLKGEPIEVVKADTVDIEVPARAEFVLEGKLQFNSREVDGPFGESTGFYITTKSYTMEVEVITHRQRPIYTVFQPWSMDDELITSMIWGAEIYEDLKTRIPGVKDLRLTSNGALGYISIEKRSDIDARDALYFVLASNEIVKNAVVVDEDVDIYNPREVDWALSYRFQGNKDLVLLEGLRGSPIDPSARMGGYTTATSKVGIDATKPLEDKARFEKISIPKMVKEKVSAICR